MARELVIRQKSFNALSPNALWGETDNGENYYASMRLQIRRQRVLSGSRL